MSKITALNPYTLPEIHFVGGSTQDLLFRVYFERNKQPFDLSSCTADFSIISYVNKEGTPLLSKPMEIKTGELGDGGIPVWHHLSVVLEPHDTVGMYGKFIYQITIKDVSGIVEIPDQGILWIVNNIHKSYVQ